MNLEQQLIQEFGTATFSDWDVAHKGLGYHRADDKRDWKARRFLVVERNRGFQHYANPLQLNQGNEGACVGFGTTGVINAEPEVHSFTDEFAFDLYHLAQTMDEWPGENYEGTSIRAGAKAGQSKGFFSNYAFTNRVEDLAIYLLNHGASTIGVDWYTGMDRVDADGFIHPLGSIRGGHCVVIDGVVWHLPGEVDRFRIRNSWGGDWGLNGRCRISAADLQQLFDAGGTACMPVEVAA